MSLVPYIICALQEVYDPEVGVNIVDLGLVYGILEDQGNVRIQMSMTHRSCPLTSYITGMTEAMIRQSVSGVRSVAVELVWEPKWSADMVEPTSRNRIG